MKNKTSIPAILLLALILSLFAACGNFFGDTPVHQPIAFNHQIHVKYSINCQVCHGLVTTSARAGLPGKGRCRGCHEDVLFHKSERDKVLRYYDLATDIPWKRVYRLAPHVHFSHQRHVRVGKISCVQCHGNVAAMSKPITTQALKISMDRCLNCHKKKGASTDCVDCHR